MVKPNQCGQTIILYEKTKTGVDSFNRDTYTEEPVSVANVFVGNPEGSEVVSELQMTGKRIAYTIGIPKGDTHNWKDVVVQIGDRKFKTFGEPVVGNADLMPFDWGINVKVEAYE